MTSSHSSERLLALDVFRGMTIAFMILVNTPGSLSHVYPPLLHAKWSGVTPTDLVFPFFLFIVGISLFLSAGKFNHELSPRSIQKIAKRTALIFIIGLGLNWFPFSESFNSLRIMGVLQRIALAYGLGALLCLGISIKHLWKVGIGLLLAYWALMWGFGGDSPYTLKDNLALKVDLFLLGTNHLYGGFGIPFDPEGLFSTIPAIGTVIFGYYIGSLTKAVKDKTTLTKNLLLIGVLAIFAGLAWNIFFPLNKPLWSSSYVIYTGGIASCFLAILIELIDVRQQKSWTKPFQVFGLNPLIIYVLSGLLVKVMFLLRWENSLGEARNGYSWLYKDVFASLFPQNLKFASLLFALSIVSICWFVGCLLYRKRVIIKV